MAAVAGNAGTSIGTLVMRRWQEIDPLLPDPGPLPPGCGAEFTIAGGTGEPAAAATCAHAEAAPGSLDTAWGTARRFELASQITGPDIGGTLDRLLGQWRDHLATVAETEDEDSAAVVRWRSWAPARRTSRLRKSWCCIRMKMTKMTTMPVVVSGWMSGATRAPSVSRAPGFGCLTSTGIGLLDGAAWTSALFAGVRGRSISWLRSWRTSEARSSVPALPATPRKLCIFSRKVDW